MRPWPRRARGSSRMTKSPGACKRSTTRDVAPGPIWPERRSISLSARGSAASGPPCLRPSRTCPRSARRSGRAARPTPLAKRRQDLARETLHRAHHARMLQVAEPEAAVEVRDAHHLFDPLDLADHRVRRADDQETIEQVVGVGLLGRRYRDRAAALDALVLIAQRERDAHVPAGLLGGGPRVGLAFGDVDCTLDADAERLRGLGLRDQ